MFCCPSWPVLNQPLIVPIALLALSPCLCALSTCPPPSYNHLVIKRGRLSSPGLTGCLGSNWDWMSSSACWDSGTSSPLKLRLRADTEARPQTKTCFERGESCIFKLSTLSHVALPDTYKGKLHPGHLWRAVSSFAQTRPAFWCEELY